MTTTVPPLSSSLLIHRSAWGEITSQASSWWRKKIPIYSALGPAALVVFWINDGFRQHGVIPWRRFLTIGLLELATLVLVIFAQYLIAAIRAWADMRQQRIAEAEVKRAEELLASQLKMLAALSELHFLKPRLVRLEAWFARLPDCTAQVWRLALNPLTTPNADGDNWIEWKQAVSRIECLFQDLQHEVKTELQIAVDLSTYVSVETYAPVPGEDKILEPTKRLEYRRISVQAKRDSQRFEQEVLATLRTRVALLETTIRDTGADARGANLWLAALRCRGTNAGERSS